MLQRGDVTGVADDRAGAVDPTMVARQHHPGLGGHLQMRLAQLG